MWTNPQETEEIIKEILNGKLHFLCSVIFCKICWPEYLTSLYCFYLLAVYEIVTSEHSNRNGFEMMEMNININW